MKELIYSKYFESPSKRNSMEYLPSETWCGESGLVYEAKAFSERWNVDIEIFRKEQQLEVHLYFKDGHFGGLYKLDFLKLLEKCKELEIPARRTRRCRWELVLIWKEKGLC